MPPLVQPLYYDDAGNPVYAEPVPPPAQAAAVPPPGPPPQPAYIPESSASYQYAEPDPFTDRSNFANAEPTPPPIARGPQPGVQSFPPPYDWGDPTLDWLGGITGRYDGEPLRWDPLAYDPAPIESFASNPPVPPPPIRQGSGPIQSFPSQWQPTAEGSFRPTQKPDWARGWSDAEWGTHLAQVGSPQLGDYGARAAGPGQVDFNADLATLHDMRTLGGSVYQASNDPRFTTESFPNQSLSGPGSAPVPGHTTYDQRRTLAEDAARAAVLPSNRSSGIWPTVPPYMPELGYPTLEQAQTHVGPPSLMTASKILEEDPMRVTAPYGAAFTFGVPALESGEQGPGQYQPMYQGPGYITRLPPYIPPPLPTAEGPPAVEPGMYSERYKAPGMAAGETWPVEPGMYEPHYTQPGYYTPRAASTYYGGQRWPTPYSGTERYETLGETQPGPRRDVVQTLTPATGETGNRVIPDYGYAQQYTPNAGNPAGNPATPGYRAAGQALLTGGTMTKQPLATLGPTSNELAYRASQGDSDIITNADGNLIRRQDLPTARGMLLGGLFGGAAPRGVARGFNRPLPTRRPRGY